MKDKKPTSKEKFFKLLNKAIDPQSDGELKRKDSRQSSDDCNEKHTHQNSV